MRSTVTPLVIPPAEAADQMGIALSELDELVENGTVRSIEVGRRKRVSVVDVERFVEDGPPVALYRVFGPDRVLLYVGISHSPEQRFRQHAADKPWWCAVEHTEIEWIRSVDGAHIEMKIIRDERPLFNIVGRRDSRRPSRAVDLRRSRSESTPGLRRRALDLSTELAEIRHELARRDRIMGRRLVPTAEIRRLATEGAAS